MDAMPSGGDCLRRLTYALGLGFFYTLFLAGGVLGLVQMPVVFVSLYWGVAKLVMAYAVFCVYRVSRSPRHAVAGILLAASGLFSLLPSGKGFVVLAVEALAITALSLVLFDIGHAFPDNRLELAGGLLFLGVIFSIVGSVLMAGVGVFSLLLGFLLGTTRLAGSGGGSR